MAAHHPNRVRQGEVRIPERGQPTCYPLALEMSYSLLDGARLGETHASQTIDVSSSAVRFMAAEPLALGTRLDLAINWPHALDGYVALQLITGGTVVRVCGNETVVTIEKHGFKTRRTGGKMVPIR